MTLIYEDEGHRTQAEFAAFNSSRKSRTSLEKPCHSHTSLHVKVEEIKHIFMFLQYLRQITEFIQLSQDVIWDMEMPENEVK